MRVFGHRGSGIGAGENTLDSVLRVLEHPGVTGVEIDVRRSLDGQLILSHDYIAGTYNELAPRGVSLLSEVVHALRGKARVILEVKNVPWEADFDPIGQQTVVGIAAMLTPEDDFVVSSFDFSTVEAARDHGLPAALLTMPGVRPMAGIGWAADAGIKEVHPWVGDVLAEPACVQQAHDAGLILVAWPASSLQQLDQLREIGVDIAISDVAPS